jgi:hypothetical protein
MDSEDRTRLLRDVGILLAVCFAGIIALATGGIRVGTHSDETTIWSNIGGAIVMACFFGYAVYDLIKLFRGK